MIQVVCIVSLVLSLLAATRGVEGGVPDTGACGPHPSCLGCASFLALPSTFKLLIGAFAVPDDVPDLLPCDENDSDPDVLLKRVEALERLAHKARAFIGSFETDADKSLAVELKTK